MKDESAAVAQEKSAATAKMSQGATATLRQSGGCCTRDVSCAAQEEKALRRARYSGGNCDHLAQFPARSMPQATAP